MLSPDEIKQLKKKVVWDDKKIQPLFRALSDPNRCRILRLLIKSGKRVFSVSDIAALLSVSIPTASEHLSILEGGGVLRRKKIKQQVSYEIRDDDPLIKSIISIIKSSKH
ncbi:MAG: metalloregulator ArsR/SmtB family transcription factor [bacterium]|nr:metalloregulator ArsR/SmtB family transcription factor [bacterium]